MCRVIVMGACPHDDHAQSSNWGIFNQHIWGDYNQHSHPSPPDGRRHLPSGSCLSLPASARPAPRVG
ncbi:hypothetical protein CT154_10785 [Komagataeibacter xylinus]|nr:hypothetical protein CT154_10785 [Komagataeibacter xylinus]